MAEQYKTFFLTRKRKIPELPCELRECVHEPSGARIIQLAADDPENFFCLAFRTLPPSSNGIAHVLEHLTLCGSKRFPVKDPFFSMNRRSMNTFMNAFTGTDFTCYPAASQIEKDFYNLLDVYLDAVFFPKLSSLSFLQEARRFEFSEKGELSINGVVYNEMKGALSNPMRRLLQESAKQLFPDSPYGFNSGGDPKEIRSLTLEEVRSFHEAYYHPSRCLFFFYGDLPLKTHLDFLDEKILKSTKATLSIPFPQPQPRFHAPKTSRTEYPVSSAEVSHAPSFLSFSWLTTTLHNRLECLALSLLESMLFGTDAAPVKLALLRTRKCKQVSASCETDILEVPFNIVLSGCHEADAPLLRKTLFESLEKAAAEGLSQKAINIAMHELELAKSEITGDGSPFGLSLYFRSAPEMQHGLDPMKGLEIHALFDELRVALTAEPQYFSLLIRKYLLENKHLVEITMVPSATKEEEEHAEEVSFLKEKEAKLEQQEKEEILSKEKALKEFQEEEQDLSCLPMLKLSDVPTPCRTIALHHEQVGSVDLFSHTPFTNGVCYLSLVTPLPYLKEEEFWLLRLFSLLLTQLGCGNRTYQDTLVDLQAYTGGVYGSTSFTHQASHPQEIIPSWVLRGKCLERNLEKLFGLFFDFLTAPRLDEKGRIREVIEKHGTDLRNSLSSMALDYAMSKATASLSPAETASERLYGLSYYKNIRELLSAYAAKEDWLLKKLSEMAEKILHNSARHVVYCGESLPLLRLKENNLFGLSELSGKAFQPWISPKLTRQKEDNFYFIPSNVSFTALALPTTAYIHSDSPKLSLLSALMNNTFLHKQLREQGGAYGGGCSAQTNSGIFSFYSYRDPNLFSTLKAYEGAIRWIKKGAFTEENLDEAKLSILQDLDSPIAPGNRAEVAYFWWRQGKTEEARQHFKDLVRSAAKEELQALIPAYFAEISSRPFIAFTNKKAATDNLPFFAKAGRKVIKREV